MITEIANSGRLRAASWTPTTFSTALPAIATITSPAKAFEIPSDLTAGSSAWMNQSETKAEPTPAIARISPGRPMVCQQATRRLSPQPILGDDPSPDTQ